MPADHLAEALDALRETVDAALRASLLDHKTPLQNERGLARAGEILLTAGGESWFIFSGDINDFKDLNTKLNYDGADLVLNEVGTVLAGFFDISCVGFRRGGDEFVLLVPDESLVAVLEQMKAQLCPLKVPVKNFGDVEVYTSFGYTSVDISLTFRENLERADQACKAAKWNHDATPVEWKPGIETGYSGRHRCLSCRSQVSISVPPDRSKNMPPLKCMVCGNALQ